MNSKACRYVSLLIVVLFTCTPVYSFQIGGGGSSGGVSGGGTVTGSGTPDQVTKWDSTGTGITDSLLTSDTSRVRNTGGWQDKITTSSTNLTLDATHNTVYSTTGAADKTYTLPSANGLTGQVYHVYKVDSGIGGVIIAPNGSDTINGTNAATTHITCQHCGFDIKWESNVGWQVSSVVKLPPYFLYSNDSTGLLTGLDPTSVGCVQSDGTSFTVGSCGGSGSSLLQSATVNLSSTDIQNWHDTPKTLVPAQGTHTLIQPIGVALHYHFGTTAFGTSSAATSQIALGDILQAITGVDGIVININTAFLRYDEDVSVLLTTLGFSTDISTPAGPIRGISELDNQALTMQATANWDAGFVVTATIASGGSGYAAGDTIKDDGSIGNQDFLITVNTVDGGGAVLTYTVTSPGTYMTFRVGDTVSFNNTAPQSGSGTGFQLTVDSVTHGDGNLDITVLYIVIDTLTGQPVAGTPPGGSGTAGFLPKWTGSTTLGNSQWYDSGSKLLANSTTPGDFNLNTRVGINGQLELQGRVIQVATFTDPSITVINDFFVDTIITADFGSSLFVNYFRPLYEGDHNWTNIVDFAIGGSMNESTANISQFTSLLVAPTIAPGGTIGTMIGIDVEANTSNAATTKYGILIENLGPATTAYGLYINATSGGATTYSVVSEEDVNFAKVIGTQLSTKQALIAGGNGASSLTDFTDAASFNFNNWGDLGFTVFAAGSTPNTWTNNGNEITHQHAGGTYASPTETLNATTMWKEIWLGHTGSVENPGATITVTAINNFGTSQDLEWLLLTDTSNSTIKFQIGSGGYYMNVNANGVGLSGPVFMDTLTTTGSATGKKVVCVDTATGRLYASSAANNCVN